MTVTLATHWPCHRLCGFSSYRLKAHVSEMSTPPKLTIGHDQPFSRVRECSAERYNDS